MSRALLVFSEQLTPRVRYIFTTLLAERMGLEVSFTDDMEEFAKADMTKMSYGGTPASDALHFAAHGLLHAQGVTPKTVDVLHREGGRVSMFHHHDNRSALDFDVFAAVFYLLTRYEEYLSHATDEHGRFDATGSLAVQHGFLRIPVVDRWEQILAELLQARFPWLEMTRSTFKAISSIDIDNACAYSSKGFVRNLGGFAKDLMSGRWAAMAERLSVLIGNSADPYDTYDHIIEAHQQTGVERIFFFLLGDRAAYDKSVAHTDERFRALIRRLAEHAQVGIHPSYRSNTHPEMVRTELLRLQQIVNKPITKSRQHFIMLSFPHTYRQLIKAGITEDHSMGHATHLGFRAGTSKPFRFYDLAHESEMPLTIHPFCCMDGTLRHYMQLSPEEAMQAVEALVSQVRAVNGQFIAIWHNESVRDGGEWKDWRQVFEFTLKVASH